ncbi:MAG TPA: hypothetical protein VMB85_16735 [Bryobacteraceae bacterium]|nr:hypothetical protein [Bryobacteraceae bacterium]
MAIYKRGDGDTYHYQFIFKGQRDRTSTHQGNPNVARNMESAARMKLVKADGGIEEKSPARAAQAPGTAPRPATA